MGKGSGMRPGQDDERFKAEADKAGWPPESSNIRRAQEREAAAKAELLRKMAEAD